MKKLLFVFFLAAATALAADARGTVVNRPMIELAKLLQARLPPLSEDGMVEAERESHGWNFSVRVRSGQSGAEEVQISLRESAGSRSELRVQGVIIDSSLLTSKRAVNPALTAEWTDKILKLVETAE